MLPLYSKQITFQAGFPCAESPHLLRSAGSPKGELPRLYKMRAPNIGAGDEQSISANSTYALFARWEMSKRKCKAFAATERGGSTIPHAARDAGSPKLTKFFVRHQCEKFVNPNPPIFSGEKIYTDNRFVIDEKKA